MKNPNKQIIKYENMFVILSSADYLLSSTEDSTALLYSINADAYITDDHITDTIAYTNLYLAKTQIPQEAHNIINKIITKLFDIAININTPAILQINYQPYLDITDLAKTFVKRYTYAEYAQIARNLMQPAIGTFVFQVILHLFDFFYDRENIYLTCTDTPVKTIFGIELNNQRITTALCLMNSIDNVNKPELQRKLSDVIGNYLTIKYSNYNQRTLINALFDNLQNIIYAAKFYRQNCITNKYVTQAETYSYHNIVKYINSVYKIGVEPHLILLNALLALPKDILTQRHFILKNGELPFDLQLPPNFSVENPNTPEYLTNITLNETTEILDNKQYRILQVSYKFKNFKRIIPINVENTHIALCACNNLDLYLTLYIFDLYKVFYLTDLFDKDNAKEKFINLYEHAVTNYAATLINTDVQEDITNPIIKHSTYNRLLQNVEITIGAYVRKLPKGQLASDDAKKLAKELYINLPEDCTIVSEHIRKYHH